MASIYPRGKVWWIIYYVNGEKFNHALTVNGKKVRERTIAKFLKNEIENKITLGSSPLPESNTPIKKIITEYISACKNRHLAAKTVQEYESNLNKFVATLHLSKISEITELKLNQYLDIRREQGVVKTRMEKRKRIVEITPLGIDAIRHIITYVNGFLNFAVRNNYIASNPIKNLKRPKLPKLHPRFLSSSEVKAVVKHAKEESIYPAVMTAIYAGLRKGELIRLQWSDIQFERNEIIINVAKSKKFRVVPLHPDLKKILKPIRKTKGPCFDITNQRRILDRIFRNARIRDLNKKWHVFRHTFASHCVMSGVDLTTVKEYLGHANIETTMKYAHLLPTHKKEAIKKVKY